MKFFTAASYIMAVELHPEWKGAVLEEGRASASLKP
jgi:hypothetical protein